MADTDKLRPYRRGIPPSFADSQQRYLADELIRIEQTVSALIVAAKALEARIAALEPP